MKLFAVLFWLILGLSCSSSQIEKKHRPHASNDKFLKDDIDVKIWQEKFENRKRDVYKNLEKITGALSLKPGMRVADIGAGTGIYLKSLHEKIKPGGAVVAVDIAPVFVKFMKARAKRENLPLVEVIKGKLDSSTLKAESVDMVFVCDTYHHFDRPDLMLRDFYRILKPGGELVIIDFEKIPGKSRPWILNHISKTKKEYREEISSIFQFEKESKIGLEENFMLHFRKAK